MQEKIKELEKLCKPIVYCKKICVLNYGFLGHRILFVNLNNENKSYESTKLAEEKDNILITDDFIFIKD